MLDFPHQMCPTISHADCFISMRRVGPEGYGVQLTIYCPNYNMQMPLFETPAREIPWTWNW